MRSRGFLFVGVLAIAAVFCGAARAQVIAGQYVVVLKPDADVAVEVGQTRARGGSVLTQYSHALKGYAAQLSRAELAAVRADGSVLFVAPDREVHATATCPLNTQSGFPAQCLPPGVDRIEGDRSSTRSGDGRRSVDVNVAVLDTGTDASHPDLNVAGGVNCTNDKLSATVDPDRNFGHGTFSGGIIGARDNEFGIVGTAPAARLFSVRALRKNGSATTSMIVCGIDWVTSTRMDGDPTNDIAVANMSLGGSGADDGNCGNTNRDAMHLAICRSVAAGVVYVVSAGNDSVDLQEAIPAAYDEVLTVTAMADYDGQPGGVSSQSCLGIADDTAAFFSNFATLPTDQAHTVAAPGVCVVSTVPPGFFLPDFETSYGIASGTSFSAPHVAGLVALCIGGGECAGLSPAGIVAKIVGDAAAYNAGNPGYGFAGDPQRPESGKYYGYLVAADLY